ncbi:helix-turn-helix domain protein [Clostridium sp. FS41]|nr:helix-turn-helix domain protein [Clostridium sp. FS41]
MLYSNIKVLCESAGISISQLERILKFPRSSICKWNDNEPGIWRVQKVADYFGVPIEKLLEDRSKEVIINENLHH